MPMPLWRGNDADDVGVVNLHRSEIEVGGMLFVDFEGCGVTRAGLRGKVVQLACDVIIRRKRAWIEDFGCHRDVRPVYKWFLQRRGRFRIV